MQLTDWNKAAQLCQFQWGLRKEVKDKLAHTEAAFSLSLNAFIELVIQTGKD